MTVSGVWIGNAAWPSNESCKQFALDVFRLSGASTDKEKALAFYTWFTRCMMRGQNLESPDGAGDYSRNYDCLSLLTSWGHGECTFWGWVATECLASAGLKTRRVVVHKQGHTYYECWYAGDDGVEQWHAFDPFGGWYFLNERGEVASCAELAANPQLAQCPLPGHPVPLGHHPERGNLAHRHRCEDQIFIEQPLRNEVNAWTLERGMQVTIGFAPQTPEKALFANSKAVAPLSEGHKREGSHCDITAISKLGFQQQKDNVPYWENYLWPTQETAQLNEGRPVRWHGAGAVRWKPLQQGLSVTCEQHNAVIENGALRPSGAHQFTEVWYHIKTPYLISDLNIDYDVKGAGDDYFGICISTDDRRSWWPMPLKSHAPHWGTCSNGQREWRERKSSLQGLREFWIRVDMVSHHDDPSLAMQGLDISVSFQHNMHVQPRLLPHDNELWVKKANADNGESVRAAWIYQIDGSEECVSVADGERLMHTLPVDRPRDVLMTGIQISCE